MAVGLTMEISSPRNMRRLILLGIILASITLLFSLLWDTIYEALHPEPQQQVLIVPSIVPASSSKPNKPSSMWHSITVKQGNNLSQIFNDIGLSQKVIAEIMTLGETVEPLKDLKAGTKIRIQVSSDQQLLQLEIRLMSPNL